MTKFARVLESGVVAEVTSVDPATAFVPEIASRFVAAPDSVKPGDTKTAAGFEKAEVSEVEAPTQPRLMGHEILAKWMTRAERLAYKEAAATDPVVADFKEMLAIDPVDLDEADTISAIDQLKTLGVLTAARATELKALEV